MSHERKAARGSYNTCCCDNTCEEYKEPHISSCSSLKRVPRHPRKAFPFHDSHFQRWRRRSISPTLPTPSSKDVQSKISFPSEFTSSANPGRWSNRWVAMPSVRWWWRNCLPLETIVAVDQCRCKNILWPAFRISFIVVTNFLLQVDFGSSHLIIQFYIFFLLLGNCGNFSNNYTWLLLLGWKM